MSSKWGSFFQQAVAGVEARLDNILSEGEYAPDAVKAANITTPTHDPRSAAGRPAETAQPSNSRPNSRLQERLAKAVTSKSTFGSTDGHEGSPTRQDEGPAGTEESKEHQEAHPGPSTLPEERKVRGDTELAPTTTETHPSALEEAASSTPADEQTPCSLPSNVSNREGPIHTGKPVHDDTDKGCPTCGLGRGHIQALEARLAEVDSMARKERHMHVERVDALESKLKFLTREMAESAQKSATSSTAGSMEKRLAEKDKRIALLISEGQSLAATEHKQHSLIKKLRADASERDRSLANLREENERLAAQVESLRASRAAVDSLRSETEALRAKCNSLQRESTRLTLECNAKDDAIRALELELSKLDHGPSSEGRGTKSDADEKKQVVELEELVAGLRAEKERVAEKAQLQINEMRKKADTATEQCHQLKNELQTLEAKLEAMRVIAEEASSSAAGNAQAKLLRQVETLQSQYATACENWQGIEATLTSRITALEKERDEASEKESSARKKARDLMSQNRQQVEDLRQLQARLHDYQQERESSQRELAQIRRRVRIAEASLAKANEQRQSTGEPDDKARQGTLPGAIPPHIEQSPRVPGQPLSPLHSSLRTWSSELLVPQSASKPSHPESTTGAPSDGLGRASSPRGLADRTEARTPDLSDSNSPLVSGKSFPVYDASMDAIADRFSFQGQVRDDESEDNADTLSTIHRAIPDLASVSTTAAGPSIQLVERMSAGIRRLEAEKVAGKEELLRVSNQRDEARAEIVTLMKEVESGRQARDRVASLEQEVADINERYQTTLELLGEKSELVEELRADVEDVKAMYRELVERTIR